MAKDCIDPQDVLAYTGSWVKSTHHKENANCLAKFKQSGDCESNKSNKIVGEKSNQRRLSDPDFVTKPPEVDWESLQTFLQDRSAFESPWCSMNLHTGLKDPIRQQAVDKRANEVRRIPEIAKRRRCDPMKPSSTDHSIAANACTASSTSLRVCGLKKFQEDSHGIGVSVSSC